MINCNYMDNYMLDNTNNFYNGFDNTQNYYNDMYRNQQYNQSNCYNCQPCGYPENSMNYMRSTCPYMNTENYYQYSPLANCITPSMDTMEMPSDNYSGIQMRTVPIEEIRD